MSDTLSVLRSLSLFMVAGVCEIGGGWLIWKWLRDDRPTWWGLMGGVILVLYGIIPTLQASHFGRIYAVYGGFFIVLSLLWGWYFDGRTGEKEQVVGLYSEVIFPRICDLVMKRPFVAEHRQILLAHAFGGVLEIGFGTGLNLPYYPQQVRKITSVDPSVGMNRLAQKRIEASASRLTSAFSAASDFLPKVPRTHGYLYRGIATKVGE